MAEAVLYEQRGRTVLVTLNRADTRNALSRDVVDALVDALHRANADPSVSCAVIAGAGKGFSSGGNLQELKELATRPVAEIENWYKTGIHRIPLCIDALDIVTIAAVHGAAVGAGCDLTAMCDLRIAAGSATFHESFLRIGIIPGDGGAWFLPRIIGMARAKEMLFAAQGVDAATALQWGLVSRITSEATLVDDAVNWGNQIGAMPPEALRQAKRLIREGVDVSLKDHLEDAAKIQARLQKLSDHAEAVDAMIEKRKPVFTNSRF